MKCFNMRVVYLQNIFDVSVHNLMIKYYVRTLNNGVDCLDYVVIQQMTSL